MADNKSIITLNSPWCFNTEELTEGEVEELQNYFVKALVNYNYGWTNANEEQIYVGIDSNGLSDYFDCISSFDKETENEENVTVYTIEQLRAIIAEHLAKQPVEKLEEGVVYYIHHTLYGDWQYLAINKVAYVNINQRAISTAGESWEHELRNKEKYVFTKATPAQIAHYEACVKAGKYVEPESVTEFVVGKWYKWFQKDHGREQKGKCAILYDNHFEMKPWICHSSEYVESGTFTLKDAESIELIEDLSEIQDLLPDGHKDKWVKTAPKSERYLATMKFFEQLREPERSQAIANYDEDYGSGTKVPKDLAEAIIYGFEWSSAKQKHEYWMVIKDEIISGIYFEKEELLVFGKYKVGDIVVLQVCTDRYPMFKVSKDSTPDKMIDETGAHSTNPGSFRPATPEEVEAYNQGVRNIADIKPKDYKEAVHCTTQEEWDFVLDTIAYTKVLKSNFENYTEDSYIDTNEQSYGNVYGSGTEYDTILTFKQWCEKYSHSYEVKPWVAQVGDWVYVLEDRAFNSCLMEGDIVQCDNIWKGHVHFKTDRDTSRWGSYLRPKDYRKATQEEIDSVTKPIESKTLKDCKDFEDTVKYIASEYYDKELVDKFTEQQWTADNWYVEVSSKEEANAVIDAAAKMYGVKVKKSLEFDSKTWKYVCKHRDSDYIAVASSFWFEKHAKPRPITDFIQKSGIIAEGFHKSWIEKQVDAIMAGEYEYKMQEASLQGAKMLDKLHQQTQQDELVIYKPKRVIL